MFKQYDSLQEMLSYSHSRALQEAQTSLFDSCASDLSDDDLRTISLNIVCCIIAPMFCEIHVNDPLQDSLEFLVYDKGSDFIISSVIPSVDICRSVQYPPSMYSHDKSNSKKIWEFIGDMAYEHGFSIEKLSHDDDDASNSQVGVKYHLKMDLDD